MIWKWYLQNNKKNLRLQLSQLIFKTPYNAKVLIQEFVWSFEILRYKRLSLNLLFIS